MRGSAIFRTGVAPGGALAGPWVQNSLWTAARAVPSLDLRFADNKSLVDAVTGASLVTFTRASSATFVDSSGVLRSAVTNLLLRSEEFDNASWQLFGTTSRTANTTVAPNGTITADSVTLPASSGIFQIVNGLANTAYTFSIWIRCDTTQSVRLVINTNLSDPATLTVTATSTWQRFNITKTTSVGTTTVTSQVDTGGGNTFFLWGAQLEQSATVGEYIPTTSAINSAPRFDHNPTTGESLGLLVEEARTNSVTNNTMVGAVAGTPGTNPTGWTFATAQSNGLTISIVGTGVESGINYIDYRFNGTTVASPNACAFGFTNAAAATSQTWATSLYWKLVSGTTTGTINWQLGIIENTAVGTFVTGAFYNQTTPTSAALITQRPTATRTLSGGVTVGQVSHTMNIPVTGNTAIDFTIRMGLHQLEQGAFATSPILTSSATVTRAADVASITGSNFSSFYNQSEGTVFVDGSTAALTATTGFVAINAAGNTNRLEIRQSRNTPNTTGAATDVTWTNIVVSPTIVANASYKQAVAFSNASHGNSIAGSLDTSSTTIGTIAATQLFFGIRSSQTAPTGGSSSTIRRLAFWPTRLGSEVLQRISQP